MNYRLTRRGLLRSCAGMAVIPHLIQTDLTAATAWAADRTSDAWLQQNQCTLVARVSHYNGNRRDARTAQPSFHLSGTPMMSP